MAGGGGGGDVSTREQQPSRGGRRGHGQKAACLPLDVIADIAARSDPATLVRCAATCRDARRRIAGNPSLLGHLRLRDTERFVLPLLRGCLTGITTYTGGKEKLDVYMVDTTGAVDATRLVKARFTKPDETLRGMSMDSRGGLVLVRSTTRTAQSGRCQEQKLVCDMATRRFLALPPEPAFPGDNYSWTPAGVQYVLLVGGSGGEGAGADAAVGRPFQVLKAKLVLSEYRSYRRLLVHTFSSEHGAWSPLTEIPTPDLHGRDIWPSVLRRRPLVAGDVVHWLCLTDSSSYMLTLHVGAARANVTSLPASFPRDGRIDSFYKKYQYLLATATAGGNLIVLVADNDKVSAWEQSKHTKIWKPRPRLVIEKKTILGFKDDGLAELAEKESMRWNTNHVPELLWFGERSGAVLLRIHGFCLLWLDLHSKKIVRCFSSDRRLHGAEVYCPYEVDLSSWVPTFRSAVTV